MITAYLWGTPNGYKVAIALEEMSVNYQIKWVNIGAGEQHEPAFLKLSPNGKIPAIVDHETGISLMESGAILQYLAEKTGRFVGETPQDRWEVTQWLHWQMGGLGPMMGQANHFRGLEEKVPYGETRYMNEAIRLLGFSTGNWKAATTLLETTPLRISRPSLGLAWPKSWETNALPPTPTSWLGSTATLHGLPLPVRSRRCPAEVRMAAFRLRAAEPGPIWTAAKGRDCSTT